MNRWWIFVGVVAVVLAGCAPSDSSQAGRSDDARPSASTVRGLDAREALELANRWGTSTKSVTSYVDARRVSFEFGDGDGEQASVRLPRDEMVIAVAPYINQTHPCATHYMSGCQGEMVEAPIKVFARTADGRVLVDETITTMENGFFEIWLPRNLEVELIVGYEGRRAREVITTNADSRTCITTLQLS